MKKPILMMSLMVVTLFLSSCSNEQLDQSDQQITGSETTFFKENSIVSIDSKVIAAYINSISDNTVRLGMGSMSSPIYNETFTQQAGGSSTINVNSSGVTFVYKASDIPHFDPSGHAVTLWAVFFNEGDEIAEENIASMYRVNGHVIGNNGKINYGGRINEGQTKDLWYGVPLVEVDNSVLLVIAKSHGPAIPEILDEQLSTLEGGCNGDGPDPDLPCYEFLWSLHL